jgi:Zn-ribbon protein, possibly nucleic acid-binding
MEIADLIGIRKNLALLPMLQDKLALLHSAIMEAESEFEVVLKRYEKESVDVENLKRNSLSTILLKNFGRYEDKMTKESEEMLKAKMEYDKANNKVMALKAEKDSLEKRISLLKQQKREYEAELKRREEIIKSDVDSENYKKYKELDDEQQVLSRQLVEIEEAMGAARRVISTADSAMDHLSSAENWATYDVWTRGGIFSHMAKYEHIDSAQYDSSVLNSQLTDMSNELKDIDMPSVTGFDGVDSTTRAVDFWFDNIFTDMNVRERIRDDRNNLYRLREKIEDIICMLDNKASEIQKKLCGIEEKKSDIIVS